MTYLKLASRILAVTLSLALAGCIFFEGPRQRAMRNDPGFKAGYSDGCASASAQGTDFRGGLVRDDASYAASKPYRSGWSAGYSVCNNQLNRNPNPNVNGLPDQRPNP